ncbi:MAG: hypothetical protein H6999_05775 [Hahellaceae bacterium]|nr:hypothetical protein [Hahellaceae bacterium]MCP5169248.1 hypothetical protein [Hahellaceae bacterium]
MKIANLCKITSLFFMLILMAGTGNRALADIAVIVNANNPLATLTQKDAGKIFMGKLRLFPGTNLEIHAFDLATDHSLRHTFYEKLVSMNASRLARYRASYLFGGKGRLPESVADESSLIYSVNTHINGIGYVSLRPLPDNVKVVFILKTDD